MKLAEHWRIARAVMRRNRGRNFLTCLGIGVGIGSIILILSLTGSVEKAVMAEVVGTGEDLVVVRPAATATATSVVEELLRTTQYSISGLSVADVAVVRETEGVAAAAPVAVLTTEVTVGQKTLAGMTVVGTNADLREIQNLKIGYGEFLTEGTGNRAVIGAETATLLFGTSEAVGRTLTFLGQNFVVVGVLAETENELNLAGIDFNQAILVSAEYLAEKVSGTQVQQINVKVTATGGIAEIAERIFARLKEENKNGSFEVVYGEGLTTGTSELFRMVSLLLAAVAGVSLVVGGIGVMNIMLVAVSERTREIGVRKAVGASGGNIFAQFMLEALTLVVLGGILGVGLGYGMAGLVGLMTPFQPYLDWEIAGIVAGTVVALGVLFGVYPALKAARKSPIESLRFYC